MAEDTEFELRMARHVEERAMSVENSMKKVRPKEPVSRDRMPQPVAVPPAPVFGRSTTHVEERAMDQPAQVKVRSGGIYEFNDGGVCVVTDVTDTFVYYHCGDDILRWRESAEFSKGLVRELVQGVSAC